MKLRSRLFLLLLAVSTTAMTAVAAENSNDELATVKERELEEVRERISELKQSMDKSAAERDRLTGELQEIEIAISEQRMRITEIEREQRCTQNKKQALDADLAATRERSTGRRTRITPLVLALEWVGANQAGRGPRALATAHLADCVDTLRGKLTS